MNISHSVLQIPLKNLVDGKIEISNVYNSMSMLFREFLNYYRVLVRLGRLPPIEDLTQEEKKQLWEWSKTISSDTEERKKLCKVSYVIDYMVSENF